MVVNSQHNQTSEVGRIQNVIDTGACHDGDDEARRLPEDFCSCLSSPRIVSSVSATGKIFIYIPTVKLWFACALPPDLLDCVLPPDGELRAASKSATLAGPAVLHLVLRRREM